jgi:molecular chaperone GrpE
MNDDNEAPNAPEIDETLVEGAPEPALDDGPAQALAEKDAEIADLKDRMLRAAAETENTRRRLERDKADSAAYAVTGFARDMLAVADNLRRAVAALPAASDFPAFDQVRAGIEATERELLAIFGRHGITRVEAVGAKLDPNRHQAMMEVDSDAEAGSIVQELQAGYLIKDRLLRPALVAVAKAG